MDPSERRTEETDIEVLDLRRAILSLPLAFRLPLVLHYHLGLTTAEIGRALGIPAGTVRFRLSRARRRLRADLEDPSPGRTGPRGLSLVSGSQDVPPPAGASATSRGVR